MGSPHGFWGNLLGAPGATRRLLLLDGSSERKEGPHDDPVELQLQRIERFKSLVLQNKMILGLAPPLLLPQESREDLPIALKMNRSFRPLPFLGDLSMLPEIPQPKPPEVPGSAQEGRE